MRFHEDEHGTVGVLPTVYTRERIRVDLRIRRDRVTRTGVLEGVLRPEIYPPERLQRVMEFGIRRGAIGESGVVVATERVTAQLYELWTEQPLLVLTAPACRNVAPEHEATVHGWLAGMPTIHTLEIMPSYAEALEQLKARDERGNADPLT